MAGGGWRVGILLPTLKSRIKRRLAAVDILTDSGGAYGTGDRWQVAGEIVIVG